MQGIRSRIRAWKEKHLSCLLHSEGNWEMLDRLGIPGFGTHLLRTFYPVEVLSEPRWGYGSPPLRTLVPIFERNHRNFRNILNDFSRLADHVHSWSSETDTQSPTLPVIDSVFFAPLDVLALVGFLCRSPKRYIEIGSGNSTCIAYWVRQQFSKDFSITSIDPDPRREIDQLCDASVRSPLQETDIALFKQLEPGDILFFDGSHYTFPGNDVVVFFLEILPAVAKGVYVHLHDIFLPFDYPADVQKQLWSEQYLLGVYLLNDDTEILFPSAYLSSHTEFSERLPVLPEGKTCASSLWFRK